MSVVQPHLPFGHGQLSQFGQLFPVGLGQLVAAPVATARRAAPCAAARRTSRAEALLESQQLRPPCAGAGRA